MASKFFVVHHEISSWQRLSGSGKPPRPPWPLGAAWDEAVAKNLEAGFYNHCFCPIGPEGPAYCIWEVREGISAEEFQEFIDGPNGVNFGLGAWMNICREINLELAGTPPIPGSSELPLPSGKACLAAKRRPGLPLEHDREPSPD